MIEQQVQKVVVGEGDLQGRGREGLSGIRRQGGRLGHAEHWLLQRASSQALSGPRFAHLRNGPPMAGPSAHLVTHDEGLAPLILG